MDTPTIKDVKSMVITGIYLVVLIVIANVVSAWVMNRMEMRSTKSAPTPTPAPVAVAPEATA